MHNERHVMYRLAMCLSSACLVKLGGTSAGLFEAPSKQPVYCGPVTHLIRLPVGKDVTEN